MAFVTRAQKFDVVSLGDVVADEFIHLPEGLVPRVSKTATADGFRFHSGPNW